MHLNLLAFAIPLFIGLMTLEYCLAGRRRRRLFRFPETIANLNVGIGERLADMLTSGAAFWLFSWLYDNHRLMTIPGSAPTYLILFIVTDFLWYWYHRLAHEVSVLWAAHGVHHQSNDFNYTVSARITVFQSAVRCVFWSALPLMGFHPASITVMLLFHGAYPFFTHTQLLGRLGWLEYVLVTPTHHAVHHSSNPEYLDKNYGDVLIIWDKLFGTFAELKQAPVFGLTQPLTSYSFLWQHFHLFMELWVAVARAKGFRRKLMILAGRPHQIDAQIRPVLERRFLRRRARRMVPGTLRRYIRLQTGLTLLLLFLLILFESSMDGKTIVIASSFILLSAVNTGAMLEQHRWVFALEVGRLSLCGLWLAHTFSDLIVTYLVIIAIAGIMLFYRSARDFYLARIYAA